MANGPAANHEPLFPPHLHLEVRPPPELADALGGRTVPKTFDILHLEPVAACAEILSQEPDVVRWLLVFDGGVTVDGVRSEALHVHLGTGTDRTLVAFRYGRTGVVDVVGALDAEAFREGLSPAVVDTFDRSVWDTAALERADENLRWDLLGGYAGVMLVLLLADGDIAPAELAWIRNWLAKAASLPATPAGAVIGGEVERLQEAMNSLQQLSRSGLGAQVFVNNIATAVGWAHVRLGPTKGAAFAADLAAVAAELAALPRDRGFLGNLFARSRGSTEDQALLGIRQVLEAGASAEFVEGLRRSAHAPS